MRGVLAMLERSLRLDARQISSFAARVLVLCLCIAGLWMVTLPLRGLSAPGRQYILSLAYLNVVMIGIVSCQHLASVITEEREAGTLGLLLMTGMSPLVILLGKSTTQLIQILLLVLLQLPFALLAITLGGVLIGQVLAAIVAVSAFLLFTANLGLLVSVVFRQAGNVKGCMVIALFAYGCLPYVARITATGIMLGEIPVPTAWQPAIQSFCLWVAQIGVMGRLSEVLASNFTGSIWWAVQPVSNTIAGVACFLLSWWLFPWGTRDPDQVNEPRGMVGQRSKKTAMNRWSNPGRPQEWPIIWHAFHFAQGGLPMCLGRLIGYLFVWFLVAFLGSDFGRQSLSLDVLIGMGCGTTTLLLILEIMHQAGSIFAKELRQQTWWALQLLPKSTAAIAYGKASGCLLSLAPGIILAACLWGMTVLRNLENFGIVITSVGFWTSILCGLAFVYWLTYTSIGREGQGDWLSAVIGIAVAVGLIFLITWSEVYYRGAAKVVAILIVDPLMIAWIVGSHWLIADKLNTSGNR